MALKTKLYALIIASALGFCASEAVAAHSTYSPMAPRQISQKASSQDYSYGLSVLPGNSIDSIQPNHRTVGWTHDHNELDRPILRPVAHAYSYLPDGVQNCVGNFLFNLSEINNTVNNTVLLEPGAAARSLGRLCINSTLGLLGLFDVASYFGIEKAPMAMSTVMGRAGADQGAFIMMPFMGPTTERDLHGDIIDSWPYQLDAVDPWIGVTVSLLRAVHGRAQFIDQESLVDNSVNPYAQVRQIYLMYQEGKVHPQQEGAQAPQDDGIDESFLDEIDN